MADLVIYLSYPEPGAVIEWLQALGFSVRVTSEHDGRVVHSELRRGDAVVMVAGDDAAYTRPPLVGVSTGVGAYLVVDPAEVDELHAAAVLHGAQSVFPPEDTEWGTRRARVLDPGGREWSFGSYRPGQE
ncbi:VOC family protein [Leifsonia sp. LS-T14]|uniref:VOC family protein n=1 Tax=unclassified Leifsonia TaxID=2663824 RepID=UPI0035A6D70F